MTPDDSSRTTPPPAPWRVVAGGILMGLANLVPGISGGTMILAMGLYDRFIGTLADLARLRITASGLGFVALLATGAATALIGASNTVVYLVTEHRWAMYSLFIGLTLGGAPELWRLCGRPRASVLVAVAAGVLGMWLFAQSGQRSLAESWINFVWVAVLAASSMILPGISGAYVLLLFGVYETVIGSVSPTALRQDLMGSLSVLVPVGIGAAIGIGGLSNLLKWLLARYSGPTHGVLLGLLLGSVLGLWPFTRPLHPDLAHPAKRKAIEAVVIRGQEPAAALKTSGVDWDEATLLERSSPYQGLGKAAIKQLSGRTERVPVAPAQGAMALGFLALGAAATIALARQGPKHS